MNNHLPAAELIIRPASFNDIKVVREIAEKTWPLAYEAILREGHVSYMLNKLYSIAALEEQIQNHHYFFIALKDYEPIGFASFSLIEKEVYKLQKLYVLPMLQKTGAGRALLQTVETVSKSMGAKQLILNVNRKNIAKNFYERNGFTIIKEEDIDVGNDYFMNDYVMQKDV